ncbi:MAG: LacI family DNA-binding transcriptional regulator [Lachnospiraceae bacterium]|nr:LacI family DNA-binding transcriptional regulator [Lachnospiraceae bacterium]
MITIKEIASQLGLSTTTVSNVIHGKTGEVSPDTIDRVRKFLDEVEYVPNISARNLAQNRSKIIGVVLKAWAFKYDNIFQDPFVAELIGGIEKAIREKGYFMMLYISDDIAEILKHVSTWNVDGLLLFCMLDDDALRVRKKYRKPIVCIDTYITQETETEFENRFINVGLADEEGAYDAVRYLIGKGHRRIAFLADNREGVDLRRFRGYRRALTEAGIEYSDHDFFMLRFSKGDLEPVFREMARKSREVTAVFCCSDRYALMLMNACFAEGIRVPEDLSVMGFDDNALARLGRPQLTTVHQDAEYKGYLSAELLIGMIRGEQPEKKQVILRPELVIRGSVCEAPDKENGV